MNRIKHHTYLTLFIGLICIFVAVILSLRVFYRYDDKPFPKPRETNLELIQDWMTMGYISRTYGVPGEVFIEKLGLNQEVLRGKSIKEVAKESAIDQEELLVQVKEIIVEFQSSHQQPPEKP